MVRRAEQQDRPGRAAEEAGRAQGDELSPHVAELAPVGDGARDAARPERDRVRGVRRDGRHPREEQRREGHEAAAARRRS